MNTWRWRKHRRTRTEAAPTRADRWTGVLLVALHLPLDQPTHWIVMEATEEGGVVTLRIVADPSEQR